MLYWHHSYTVLMCNDWSAKNSQKYFWALLNHNEVEVKNFQIPVVNEIRYRLKNPIMGIQCWRIGQDLIKNFYKEFVLCWNLSFPFFLFFFFIFLLLHLIHLTGTWHFVETPINTGDFLNCRVSVIRSQYSRLQALNTLLPFILIKKNGFPKKHKAAFSAKSNYLLIGEVSAKPNSLLYNSNVVTDYSTTLLIKVS